MYHDTCTSITGRSTGEVNLYPIDEERSVQSKAFKKFEIVDIPVVL